MHRYALIVVLLLQAPVCAGSSLARTAGAGDLTLPPVISDHMVLQRDEPIVIRGGADAGERIVVEFGGRRRETVAGDDGAWSAVLDAMSASSEPRSLIVRSETDVIEIEDVLIGEVWLCSGQSNMVWTVRNSMQAEQFIARADEARIRMFTVPNTARPMPQETVEGQWRAASPETVGNFSAVAYHFARHLIEELDVPIGLLNASWGGSTVEAWVSRPVLEKIPEAEPFLALYDASRAGDELNPTAFAARDVDDASWDAVNLPATFRQLGHDIDGVVWFRRTVSIPETWRRNTLILELGAIDDNDGTYFNGERIGAMNNWRAERRYTIDDEEFETGPAAIAVRVEDTGGTGGFTSDPQHMKLYPRGAEEEGIDLSGEWRMRIAAERPAVPAQHRPAELYNGMIHPLRDCAIRGVIWYQGESNANQPRGEEYFTIFPALIRHWRRAFNRPDLPFLFVQLPGFTRDEPNTRWRYPVVRQAQLETYHTVPDTGMAVILDLGEADDIHPRNKHDVGERLARWALADVYGLKGIVKAGPIFTEARFTSDGAVRISFELFGSSLKMRGGEALAGFEIAGKDGAFIPAEARIEGDQVIVRSDEVPEPHAVRYAWKNNPIDANLINAEGLPASPFEVRRDD